MTIKIEGPQDLRDPPNKFDELCEELKQGKPRKLNI